MYELQIVPEIVEHLIGIGIVVGLGCTGSIEWSTQIGPVRYRDIVEHSPTETGIVEDFGYNLVLVAFLQYIGKVQVQQVVEHIKTYKVGNNVVDY